MRIHLPLKVHVKNIVHLVWLSYLYISNLKNLLLHHLHYIAIFTGSTISDWASERYYSMKFH